MPKLMRISRALISVSDKTGIEDFARKLQGFGVEVLSTGGTAKALSAAGIAVREVSDYTGFPEIMEGRVKTLHPKIHGGILAARDKDSHAKAMTDNNIQGIDLVVINLYPFAETVRAQGDFKDCIENIDVGGPAMIRAAAKNHEFVTVITDPEDYQAVLNDMSTHQGCTSFDLRQRLAMDAFAMTAGYDSAISNWFAKQVGEENQKRFSLSGELKQSLRYGENPHQRAGLYLTDDQRPGAARATQIQGKELSYNNINDTNAAFELVAEFEAPAVAIIKHANPCGVAVAGNTYEAYGKALACDLTSAFGGIIAINRTLDVVTAQAITERFVEVIIAPEIEKDALEVLSKKDKIRVLKTGGMPNLSQKQSMLTCIAGGFLVQDTDTKLLDDAAFKVVTRRSPSEAEMQDMLFAFRVCKHVKSNAIVYVSAGATVGIGAGQMSRIDSSRIAAWKMNEVVGNRLSVIGEKDFDSLLPTTDHLVVASDAFFPFADGLIEAANAGVTAVIQPGGSIRDQEVIDAANERGLAMVFTGMRHFRH